MVSGQSVMVTCGSTSDAAAEGLDTRIVVFARSEGGWLQVA